MSIEGDFEAFVVSVVFMGSCVLLHRKPWRRLGRMPLPDDKDAMKPPGAQDSHEGTGGREGAHDQGSNVVAPSVEGERQSPQARVTRQSKRDARECIGKAIELGLLFLLVVVGALQVCIYNRQAAIMDRQTSISDRQLQLSETDLRPWLVLAPVQIKSPLTYEGEGAQRVATITIGYQIENIGKLPATDYSLDVMPMIVVPSNPNPDWHAPQKERCDGQADKTSAKSYQGQQLVLLPGQKSPESPYVFRKNEYSDYFIHVGETVSYTVLFYGCITYKSLIDSDIHQSGVVFTLAGAGSSQGRDVRIDAAATDPALQIVREYTAGRAR
jgi:hypothetical protein